MLDFANRIMECCLNLACSCPAPLGRREHWCLHVFDLGLHVGDRPDNVVANRRRFASAIGIDLEGWVAGEPAYGKDVGRG